MCCQAGGWQAPRLVGRSSSSSSLLWSLLLLSLLPLPSPPRPFARMQRLRALKAKGSMLKQEKARVVLCVGQTVELEDVDDLSVWCEAKCKQMTSTSRRGNTQHPLTQG